MRFCLYNKRICNFLFTDEHILGMTIQSRYKQLIDFYTDGNKRKFSIKIGVSSSVVENIVGSRGSNPSFEIIEKTLSAFEDINARWLILGEGEMIMHADKKKLKAPEIPGATLMEEQPTTYTITKDALEMIRDLAGENALLKHKLETDKEGKRDKSKVHGNHGTGR